MALVTSGFEYMIEEDDLPYRENISDGGAFLYSNFNGLLVRVTIAPDPEELEGYPRYPYKVIDTKVWTFDTGTDITWMIEPNVLLSMRFGVRREHGLEKDLLV